MARGPSGRIIAELDPSLKQRLHARLERDGLTLKEWVIEQALRYVGPAPQIRLPLEATNTGDARE